MLGIRFRSSMVPAGRRCSANPVGHPSLPTRSTRPVVCQAASDVYEGRFGPYSIGPEDEREVLLYRAGINVAAAATVISSLPALFPESQDLHLALDPLLNAISVAGAAGLGLSLTQIHIYIDPIKKTFQLLWAIGVAGLFGIMLTQDGPAAVYVAEHPMAIWLIGPMFAALTGVAFKEGMCYSKWEAGGLFFTTPLLLLGHLFGFLPDTLEKGVVAAFCILISVFALRKWVQPAKDDVGDKSVFEFLRLSPEEQNQKLQE